VTEHTILAVKGNANDMDGQSIPLFEKPLSHEFETKAANTIRMLAADGVQAANSGHPGMPTGWRSLR
jgi:hypothetical protein